MSSLLSNFLLQLYEILIDEDEDFPPYNNVVERATTILGGVDQPIPYPRVATDGYGGLRLSWHYNQHEVRVVVKNDGSDYIYWEDGDEHGLVQDVTPSNVVKYVNSLI
jgi:hypothetical protein